MLWSLTYSHSFTHLVQFLNLKTCVALKTGFSAREKLLRWWKLRDAIEHFRDSFQTLRNIISSSYSLHVGDYEHQLLVLD